MISGSQKIPILHNGNTRFYFSLLLLILFSIITVFLCRMYLVPHVVFKSAGKGISALIRTQVHFKKLGNASKTIFRDLKPWNSIQNFNSCPGLSNESALMDGKKWYPHLDQFRDDGFVIISNVNYGYLEFAFNLWNHYKKLGLNNLIFIAEDCSSYREISNKLGPAHVAPPVFRSNTAKLTAQDFASKGFGKIVTVRPYYIYYFLNRNISVLWQDLDSAPLENPFKYISIGFDATFVDDNIGDNHFTSDNICTCLMFFNPVNPSFEVLYYWILETQNQRTNQIGFNEALKHVRKRKTLRFTVLPRTVFPNGNDFDSFRQTAAWIHANYHVGSSDKMKFLLKHGSWDPQVSQQN